MAKKKSTYGSRKKQYTKTRQYAIKKARSDKAKVISFEISQNGC